MDKHIFSGKLIRPEGIGTWTYVGIPFAVEDLYGTKSRIPVKGDIDGAAYRSSLLPQGGGRFILVVGKEIRDRIGKSAGDTVQVTVEPDTEARNVDVPADLLEALQQNSAAKDLFEGFSPSRQKEYVQWIESAKKAETRANRIAKAIGMIAEKKRVKG